MREDYCFGDVSYVCSTFDMRYILEKSSPLVLLHPFLSNLHVHSCVMFVLNVLWEASERFLGCLALVCVLVRAGGTCGQGLVVVGVTALCFSVKYSS